MDSSVATTARTCLCTIRRSWAMGTEPCRREMPSILRSFKAPRVPRLPTSQKTAAIKDLGHQNYETGRQFSALLPAVFFFVAWGEKARAGIDHSPRRQRKPVLLVLLASAL